MAREKTLIVLAKNGLLKIGTEIELMPECRLEEEGEVDPKTFKATFMGLTPNEKHVRWHRNGVEYTLSGLNIAMKSGGFYKKGRASYEYNQWRRIGQEHSLWDEAEELRSQLSS